MDVSAIVLIGASLLSAVGTTERSREISPATGLRPTEARLIERTNTERVRYGLSPLVVDLKLVKSARKHAIWMTRNRSLRHTSAAVGENIAVGQRSTVEVMRSWMNSSGHRANILSGRYTRIGVAGYETPSGTIYWCQQFLR